MNSGIYSYYFDSNQAIDFETPRRAMRPVPTEATMDWELFLLLAAFRHTVRESGIGEALERFEQLTGRPVDEDAFRSAVARLVARDAIADPVRIPPGALQCCWALELTPTGFQEVSDQLRHRNLNADQWLQSLVQAGKPGSSTESAGSR